MEFRLLYNTSMTIADFDEADIREIDWLHGRLVQQKRDEQPKTVKEAGNG